MKKTILMLGAVALLSSTYTLAKIPPPPPPDDKAKAAAEEKKAKDAATAEKAKADLAAAEDNAVKNYQANMKKAGKPIPKPVPVAAASTPAAAKAAPAGNTVKGAEATQAKDAKAAAPPRADAKK